MGGGRVLERSRRFGSALDSQFTSSELLDDILRLRIEYPE